MPAPAHNKRISGWRKKVKVDKKVKSKRQGIQKKHKEVVKLVSGARTGKAQRKFSRKQKLAEKEQAALAEAVQDIEMQDTRAAKKSAKKQQKGQQQQQQQASGAPDTMQE
ncbi:hypothetical protein N2152v2_010497 [Parachlorella kessleri]